MEISPHVAAIQADLAAAAALGDDATATAGQRLAAAVESSLQLRLLDVLTEVSLALNAQLPTGHVELRLAGRDPELVLVVEEDDGSDAAPVVGEDHSARITLRLPDGLKAQVEGAADRAGVSTNAWIVRALARSVEQRPNRPRSGNRLRGFAQS
jgi:HicB family